jgi:hypothetical protein
MSAVRALPVAWAMSLFSRTIADFTFDRVLLKDFSSAFFWAAVSGLTTTGTVAGIVKVGVEVTDVPAIDEPVLTLDEMLGDDGVTTATPVPVEMTGAGVEVTTGGST